MGVLQGAEGLVLRKALCEMLGALCTDEVVQQTAHKMRALSAGLDSREEYVQRRTSAFGAWREESVVLA